MDVSLRQTKNNDNTNQIIERLQSSRDKLTPLIDDIITSTVDLIQNGSSQIFSERILSWEQYEDLVRASCILREAEYRFFISPRSRKLPNTNVIVNKMSIENIKTVEGNRIVIDEAAIVELLELYEKMGEIIRKITEEGYKLETLPAISNGADAKPASTISFKDDNNKYLERSKHDTSSIHSEISSSSANKKADFETKPTSAISFEEDKNKYWERSKHDTSSKHSRISSSSYNKKTSPSLISLKASSSKNLNIENLDDQPVTISSREKSVSSMRGSRIFPTSKDMDVEKNQDFEPNKNSSLEKALAMRNGSSTLPQTTSSTPYSSLESQERSDDERCNKCLNNIMIKILCNMSSDTEDDDKTHYIHPVTSDSDCYKVKLGEEPVSLKVAQDCMDGGATYCVSAETDDEEREIKIVIKQCPQCHTTVVGSSAKIADLDIDRSVVKHDVIRDVSREEALNENSASFKRSETSANSTQNEISEKPRISQESISKKQHSEELRTLSQESIPKKQHSEELRTSTQESIFKKQQNIMSDEKYETIQNSVSDKNEKDTNVQDLDGLKTTKDKSSDNKCPKCLKNCAPRIVINIAPPTCDKLKSTCNCKETTKRNVPKMDVVLDVENVDKSSIQVLDETRSDVEVPIDKKVSAKPLMRGRICSSMEFDVTTADTRLRNQEINHTNSHIVVELRKLGVDQILRASRPAKCCRKAILNEKQKMGLPYSVSLRSLPLLANDVNVIQQSIDMSLKKIKNSLDIAEDRKQKLAYYVTLEPEPFRANINFPWVTPVYDVKVDSNKPQENGNKISRVKKNHRNFSYVMTRMKNEHGSNETVKGNKRKRSCIDKFYILKKPRVEECTSSSERMKCSKLINRAKRVKFKEKPKNKSYRYRIVKTDKPSSTSRRNFLLKPIWKTIGYEKTTTRKIYYKESTSADDLLFNSTLTEESISNYTRSEYHCSSQYQDIPHLRTSKTKKYESTSRASFMKRLLIKENSIFLPQDTNSVFDVYFCNLKNTRQVTAYKSFSDTHLLNISKPAPSGVFSASSWNHFSHKTIYPSKFLRIRKIFQNRKEHSYKIEKPVMNQESYIGLVYRNLKCVQPWPLRPYSFKSGYKYVPDDQNTSGKLLFNTVKMRSKTSTPKTSSWASQSRQDNIDIISKSCDDDDLLNFSNANIANPKSGTEIQTSNNNKTVSSKTIFRRNDKKGYSNTIMFNICNN